MRPYLLMPWVALVACGPTPGPPQPESGPASEPMPAPVFEGWQPELRDARPLGAACVASMPALTAAEISAPWAALSMESPPGEPGLGLFTDLRRRPGEVRCRVRDTVDSGSAGGHGPVEGWLGLATRALGGPEYVWAPAPVLDFEAALKRLCEAAGGCEPPQGELSPPMRQVLAPIFVVLADALDAQAELFAEDPRGEDWWREHGGHLVLLGTERPNPSFDSDVEQLRGPRAKLYASAIRIAHAVESTAWPSALVGEYRVVTRAGLVHVAGTADDVHREDGALLRIDQGGDDVYLGADEAPVNILIDLGGRDLYAYPGAEQSQDTTALPDDGGGRGDVTGLATQATLSEVPRQGAARGGISMLFDLGVESDRYVTLRGGQGYAQQGVGVLFDAGGDDVYLAEAGAQGAAQMGIGLLIDLGGGDDRREALSSSQGFAGPGGFGALIDDGGDDRYLCAPTPARYPSPQQPEINASLCQGASLGFRGPTWDESWPGGVGLLYDRAGDDDYQVGVFGQGVGYWKGTGLLVDDQGADALHHRWYGAGAGVHYGVGVLLQGGAEADVYGDPGEPAHMSQGAAHHLALGVVIEQGGSDTYHLPTMGAGAADCGAVGMFLDEAGADNYLASHRAALGVAALGTCDEQGEAFTRALFIDAQGLDAYPSSVSGAQESGRWATQLDAHDTVVALGVDLEVDPQ